LDTASSLQKEIAEIRQRLEEEFLARSSASIQHRTSTTRYATTATAAPVSNGCKDPFPTVEQLLIEQREQHFNRFIAAEHARNEAHALQKQIAQMETSLYKSFVMSWYHNLDCGAEPLVSF
jgi:hypothetical protein